MKLNRCTFVGDHVAYDLSIAEDSVAEDCTIIGYGRETECHEDLAFKALFGIAPLDPQDGLSGKIILQLGDFMFDLELLMDAAKSRRDKLANGASTHDLIIDRRAMQELKFAHDCPKDN